MRALRFDSFSGVEGLQLATIHNPLRASSEVLIEVCAASINPSDVKNVQGIMQGTTLPRTPGRDFAGIVVEGPEHLQGRYVWGAGGEVGYTRDGSHAEYLVMPESAVSLMPSNLSFAEAAAAGVAFVTAWSGVRDVIDLGAGETIVITGAMGAVGTAVTQLARWIGAKSIGVVRKHPGDLLPTTIAPDFLVESNREDLTSAVRAISPSGIIDAIFDTVGEPVFSQLIDALSIRGRYALIANTGKKQAELELVSFYRKQLRLGGVDSRGIDAVAAARILDRIRPGFESGALQAPKVDKHISLDDARAAYSDIAAGTAAKIVIDPRRFTDR